MLWLFNLIGARVGVNAAWRMFSLGLPLLALAAGAAAGAWGAWQIGRAPLHTELAELKSAHSELDRLAQQAAAQRLQTAQARSSELALDLQQTLHQTETLMQEKTHALHLASTGRVCLNARALGVLHTAPGLRVAGFDGVPTAQPSLVAPGAAAGAHPHPGNTPGEPGLIATDEDIGAWAIGAGAAHEACRARLDALIDWHTPTPP